MLVLLFSHQVVSNSFVTPWTVAGMPSSAPWDFPGKNTGVELSFPSPDDIRNPGTELASPALQADYLLQNPQGSPLSRILLVQKKKKKEEEERKTFNKYML